MTIKSLIILRMSEFHSIETLPKYLNLSNETRFRLNEVIKIEENVNSETQRKAISKKLGKYIATFDYIDNTLVALSAKNEGLSVISLASVIGAPAGIASASFTLYFLWQQE